MTREDLLEALNDAEEEYIDEAMPKALSEGKETSGRPWLKWTMLKTAALIAAASLLVLCITAALRHANHKPEAGETGETDAQETQVVDSHILERYLISAAKYPEELKRPDVNDFDLDKNGEISAQERVTFYDAQRKWSNQIFNRKDIEGYDHKLGKEILLDFNAKVMKQFLKEQGHENRIYSPINIYVALGMLAETSEGNTRKQILDLLGMEKIEDVRTEIKGLWNRVYRDDDLKSVLASSVWLRDDIPYKKSTLDILAEDYYASSFAGKMYSEEYSQAFRNWLNIQTDGLLKEQIGGLKFDADTAMALATTVCFSARWSSSDEFRKEDTKPAVFHAVEGDMQCDFMNRSGSGMYYYGDHFGAILKIFDASRSNAFMAFILPDEGTSVYDLLSDEQVMRFIEKGMSYENSVDALINESIPMFDVSSDRDLIEDLKELGITDAFEEGTANFSPITDAVEDIWISKVQHGVRVITDEEGVKAAAYTVEEAAGGSALISEEIDFVLDRPFLFVISAENGTPLFIGIVEKP